MVEDKHVAAFQDYYRSNRSIILAVPVVGLVILFLYSQSISFSAWIGINLLCQGTKGDNFGGQLLAYGFGKICASQECWIRLILLIEFYIILRFSYLFGIFIIAHKFFRVVLCRLNYFNKIA